MTRLLLVDDEPVLLIPTKTFLEKDNVDIECDTANSAHEALEKLAASPYDAIVSDYDMPEMDGIALLKEVRRCYGTLPFILFTGRGRESVVIEALNNGADFYIQRSGEPRALYAELSSKIMHAVDRRRAREALRESEKEARARIAEIETIYASAPVGLCLLGMDTRYLQVNERFAEMNGFSVEDHIGKTIRELVPDVADAAEALTQKVIETGKPVLDIEILGETPAQPGMARYWKESWVPLKDDQGQVTAINIVAEEITERKRAEEAMRETILELQTTIEELKVAEEEIRQQNEELIAVREELHAEHQRYVELFECAPDGYMVTDTKGVIQEINREGARQLNVNGENLVGKPLVIFIAKDDRVKFHTLINQVNCGAAKEMRDRRVTLQPRDDSPFQISLNIGAVCDAGDNLIGLRWLLREITAQD